MFLRYFYSFIVVFKRVYVHMSAGTYEARGAPLLELELQVVVSCLS